MPVRLLRPYAGQNVGTIYSGADEATLRYTGTADDYVELATNYVPNSGQVFRAYASSFTTAKIAGSIITTMSDPFRGQGRGVTTYATTGTVPAQLALGTTNQILVGATAATAGTVYQISIIATSGDGLVSTPAMTFNFKAVPFSFSAGTPGFSGGGNTPTPPGPVATPLALGDKIAFLGCSVEAESGWRGYLRAFMQGIMRRVDTAATSYFGFPGSTPVQFQYQLPNLLATRPNIMVIGDWVNATTPGTPAALSVHTNAVMSYMQQFGAQSQAKEIWLFPTRITEGATAQSRAYQASVVSWCQSQAGTMVGNAFVRFFNVDNDLSTTLGKQRTYDGTHDTTVDAFYHLGKSLRDQINPILPTGRTLPVVGTAPTGNLTTNPNLTGTTGTITGTGAADVSGTVPTGVTLTKSIAAGGNITVVSSAAANAWDIKLSGTMTAAQTGDVSALFTLPTLTKFGKYRALVKYELSNGARNGPASLLYNLAINLQNSSGGTDGHGSQIGGIGAVDTGPSGLGMGGYGLIPSQIDSTGYYPTNPETGVAESLGETWLITEPVTLATTASSLRLLFTPYANTTVDANLRILAFYLVPANEPTTVPYYQAGMVTRDDGAILRFGGGIMGLNTSGGNFPSTSNQAATYNLSQANANAAWTLTPGDWSGGNIIGGGISYDMKVELSTDGGATYPTVLLASAAASNWTFTPSGLVTGNKIRFTGTATTSAGTGTPAVEIMTIT